MTGQKNSKERSVGAELAAVLPDDGIPWYRQPGLLKLNIYIFSLIMFSSANGYDGSMMNGLQALEQWQDFMDHPKGAWLGLINAIQSIGAVVTYPVSAWVVQRYGRRMGVWIGYFFLVVSTALQTAAPNHGSFVAARFLLGPASAWFATSVPLLITECAYPTHRGIVTALYNCGWYVGSLVAAWATFGTRNYTSSWAWRIPSVLQAVIPLVAFPGFVWGPESPRWLLSQDRNEEARDMLVRYHANGDASSPLAELELREIKETIQIEQTVHATTTWADLFRTKGNRHRAFISVTLGVFAQWNGSGVVSYYLALVLQTVGITSVTNQTLISGCLQIWNLIFAVAAAFSVDSFGRRKLFLLSCGGMLTTYIVITGLSGSFAQTGTASVGTAVIPFLFLYYAFYDIAFTPLLFSYPVEIWPYRLRARGLSLTLFSTMVAVSFNIFVNPIALEAIGWKYYIVFVAILLAGSVMCYFTYPETRGYTLEEIAVVFDGDQAEVFSSDKVADDIKRDLAAKDGEIVHVEER